MMCRRKSFHEMIWVQLDMFKFNNKTRDKTLNLDCVVVTQLKQSHLVNCTYKPKVFECKNDGFINALSYK